MEITKETLTQLDETYMEQLETDIISALASQSGKSEREAMDAYYKSRLSNQVNDGLHGIQYLSPEYLANDLIENEPELLLGEGTDPCPT